MWMDYLDFLEHPISLPVILMIHTKSSTSQIDQLPVTAEDIAHKISHDPTLCKVYQHVKYGWNSSIPD